MTVGRGNDLDNDAQDDSNGGSGREAGDDSARLIDAVCRATAEREPLSIHGANSKRYLGHDAVGEPLSTLSHGGIINYEPTELVVTARSGTPIADLTAALRDARQMLPFDPPDGGGTLGGVIACGLSGPRRPYQGAARDFVLGTRVINGQGQDLRFGGEVMKNVAGYDVSRVQVGAFGTLGVLLDISMKVLPMPECELTLHHELDETGKSDTLVALARQPLPLSASMIYGRDRYIRLSGSAVAVETTARKLGGTRVPEAEIPWDALRERRLPFFDDRRPLWRLALPAHRGTLDLTGDWLLDWGGAQRWLKSDATAVEVFAAARAAGGHATRYRSVSATGVERVDGALFQPLDGPLARLQSRLRDSFDAGRLFNRGRYHPELDTDAQSSPAVAPTAVPTTAPTTPTGA